MKRSPEARKRLEDLAASPRPMRPGGVTTYEQAYTNEGRLVPWFKVDDTLHAHPKARRAGKAAMGLWALAGSYCMAYKLDGQVDSEWVAGQRGRPDALKLCDAGFWHATGHKCTECPQPNDPLGYVFHDWLDSQPSAEEIEKDREASRDRQRKFREKRREARGESNDAA